MDTIIWFGLICGSGMAPLRSHISFLFETLKTKRRVSYWYGARSPKELFYTEYFSKLAEDHENLSFHPVLSEPEPHDRWESYMGFIHEIVQKEYQAKHENPPDAEYYLCGPPEMISACLRMLKDYEVSNEDISFDEF
jgi:Na(+)-translocating NADH:ubiquinone oxidoreductase F subunit